MSMSYELIMRKKSIIYFYYYNYKIPTRKVNTHFNQYAVARSRSIQAKIIIIIIIIIEDRSMYFCTSISSNINIRYLSKERKLKAIATKI